MDERDERTLADLIDEIAAKALAGQPVDLEAYIQAHPWHAASLRDLARLVNILAGLRAPPEPEGCLGNFRILREVGRGTTGLVCEAEELGSGRRVALKLLTWAAALSPERLRRALHEAEDATRLDHPHVLPVYAVGRDRGVYFYATKLVDGLSVAHFIQRLRQRQTGGGGDIAELGSLAPDGPRYHRLVARLGLRAAQALEYAHRAGVAHGDVRPANLLLGRDGHLWVGDFGLAGFRQEVRLNTPEELNGVLPYHAPEQLGDRPGLADYRADIYGLGATLYELLTLRAPYSGRNRQELERQITRVEPPLPRRSNPSVPAELEAVVLKAMAKDPDERYATAQDLAEDLQRFLNGYPVLAPRPGPTRSGRTLAWGAGLALILLAALAAALMWWG